MSSPAPSSRPCRNGWQSHERRRRREASSGAVAGGAGLCPGARPARRGGQPRRPGPPPQRASIHPGVTTITGPNQCTPTSSSPTARARSIWARRLTAHRSATPRTTRRLYDAHPSGRHLRSPSPAAPPRGHALQLLANDAGRKETDENTCTLQRLGRWSWSTRTDHGRVNPSIPYWGGPTGLAKTDSQRRQGAELRRIALIGGTLELKPRQGLSRGQSAGGWTHTVFTLLPGLPGDSGSGLSTARAGHSAS